MNEKITSFSLIQAGLCSPQVWVLYYRPTSLRLLHSMFTVWETICLSGCESSLIFSVMLFSTILFGVSYREKQKWMA